MTEKRMERDFWSWGFELKPDEMQPLTEYPVYVGDGLVWVAHKSLDGTIDVYKYVKSTNCEEG